MKLKLAFIAALAGSAFIAAASAPASAKTIMLRPSGPVAGAQWHGNGGGWNRGGWNRGYRGYGYRGYGPALGGFAAGAIIGGALAAQAAPYPYYAPAPTYVEPGYDDSTAYCIQRFRSYDPASGTYLGNDGYRHPCP